MIEENVKCLLDKYNQQHLLQFCNTNTESQNEQLLADIQNVDYDALCKQIYFPSDAIKTPPEESIDSHLEPLDSSVHQSITSTPAEKIAEFRRSGLEQIANGKVAALLLAGGQGTRLGSPLPKGMFDLQLPSGKTLYQIQAERIYRLQQLAHQLTGKRGQIPWYIMTSEHTLQPTIDFLKQNDYFKLNPNNVVVFQQDTIPCFTFDGKIILSQPYKLARAPNGNGGLYEAMRKQGILADMKRRGIQHVQAYCVDNVLVKVADPIFIGYCLWKGAECAAKVVEKVTPHESVGIICKVKGQFKVVEYSEVSSHTAEKRNAADGRLLFNAGNICNHYFTLDFLADKVKEDELIYHIAKKKIPYVDTRGVLVQPDKPNGIKLEKFVFDVFRFADKFAVWEVLREDEFSPLKNNDKDERDTPTTARLSLYNLHQRYVLNAGGKFETDDGNPAPLLTRQIVCEISPLVSYDGENLETRVKGKTFKSPFRLD